MSGGANILFTTTPAAFLANNVVIPSYGDLPGGGNVAGTYWFDLQLIPGRVPTAYWLVAMPAANHVPTPPRTVPTEPPIQAHWIPYAPNAYNEIDLQAADVLVPNVDYVFTATLSGCTCAVGPGPQPLISHINHQNPPIAPGAGTTINQAQIDLDVANHFPGGTAYQITQATYQGLPGGGFDLNHYFNVLGIRNPTGAFDFSMQRYTSPHAAIPQSVEVASFPNLAAHGITAFGGAPPAPPAAGGVGHVLAHAFHGAGRRIGGFFGRR